MMNWRAIFVTVAIFFLGALFVQANGQTPQVRSEAGRNDPYASWKLPAVDDVKATRRAAEGGSVSAQFRLAVMYFNGDGLVQDYTEAANWFRKAAEQGNAVAQKNLGVMYGKGYGVPQSNAEAYVWANIATISGNEAAIKIRDYAANTLSPEDLATARNRVAKLYEQIQQKK